MSNGGWIGWSPIVMLKIIKNLLCLIRSESHMWVLFLCRTLRTAVFGKAASQWSRSAFTANSWWPSRVTSCPWPLSASALQLWWWPLAVLKDGSTSGHCRSVWTAQTLTFSSIGIYITFHDKKKNPCVPLCCQKVCWDQAPCMTCMSSFSKWGRGWVCN